MPERRARPNAQSNTSQTEAFSGTDFIDQVIVFLGGNWWWIVLLLLLIGAATFIIRKLRQHHDEIQKLWVFTLFFLTKRQMMIPLVIELSSRDKVLDKTTQEKLMEIRDRCREVSFKKSPKARLELETEVSEILFTYFSKLEKKDQIRAGTKLAKIVQDLEFIDAKLVQLQKVYNAASYKWNQKIQLPFLQTALKPFGIKTFEPFS